MDWDKTEEHYEESRAFLTFDVGQAVFAVDVGHVREILDPQPTTPIPGARHRVLGMIDLRGNSITTVDGADVFDVPPPPDASANQRLVVFEVATPQLADTATTTPAGTLLAVRVDRVRAVEDFLPSQIDAAPEQAGSQVVASSRRDGDTVLFLDITQALGRLVDPGQRAGCDPLASIGMQAGAPRTPTLSEAEAETLQEVAG